MGVVYHLRSHVTAKAWNNYFPRFLFYFKIRLLFIEYRFKNKKRKNPSPDGKSPFHAFRSDKLHLRL